MLKIIGMEEYVYKVDNMVAFIKYKNEQKDLIYYKVNLDDTSFHHIREWFIKEMGFYSRMQEETTGYYNVRKNFLERTCRYYSEEDIKNCGRDLLKMYEYERNNKELLKEYAKNSGVAEISRMAREKVEKYQDLILQMNSDYIRIMAKKS